MAKAVIVGCGRIAGYFDGKPGAPATSHARAYSSTPGLAVAACVDVVLEKARTLAKKYKPSAFGANLAEALAAHAPDVVSVCTPDATHFAVAESVLSAERAPKVLFIEKPACSSPEEYARLTALADERETLVVVNHSRRFDGRYRRLREEIATNRFGALVRADAFYYGGIRHNGSHVVDTLRFLFPGEFSLSRVGTSCASRHPGDPTLDVELDLPKNAKAFLHGFDEARYQIFDFDLKFERARLRVENFESRWTFERRALVGGENVLVPAKLALGPSKPTPLENAVAAIARHLKTGDRRILDPYTIEAAEGTMKILWEAAR